METVARVLTAHQNHTKP